MSSQHNRSGKDSMMRFLTSCQCWSLKLIRPVLQGFPVKIIQDKTTKILNKIKSVGLNLRCQEQ